MTVVEQLYIFAGSAYHVQNWEATSTDRRDKGGHSS